MADTLSTARLILRPMLESDADALHAVFSDPDVMRYFDDPHRTFSETQNWVRGSVGGNPDQTREYVTIIAYHNNIKSINLGERTTFADLGQTIAELFDLERMEYGTSFYQQLNLKRKSN